VSGAVSGTFWGFFVGAVYIGSWLSSEYAIGTADWYDAIDRGIYMGCKLGAVVGAVGAAALGAYTRLKK